MHPALRAAAGGLVVASALLVPAASARAAAPPTPDPLPSLVEPSEVPVPAPSPIEVDLLGSPDDHHDDGSLGAGGVVVAVTLAGALGAFLVVGSTRRSAGGTP